MTGVTQMLPCSVDEFLHLLKVCEDESSRCAMELRLAGSPLDCDVGIADEIPQAVYEELGDGDCISVTMGSTELSFEIPNQCFKDTSGRQICVAIANERYIAFFNSGRLSSKAIRRARWYQPSSANGD